MERRAAMNPEGVRRRGRRLETRGVDGWRRWDPFRSKLAAYLLAGGRRWPFAADSRVLYLGAAEGTTLSHLGDTCPDGRLTGVEISRRAFVELLALTRARRNLLPVLADAHFPHRYRAQAHGAEVLYQDIAQRDQLAIFLRNWDAYRPHAGFLMLKARAVDVAAKPAEVFAATAEALRERFATVEHTDISRWARDHAAFYVAEEKI